MNKEQKVIRDQKIDEMVWKLAELDKLSREEILHGERETIDCGRGKTVVIYKNLSKITRQEIACVKDTLSFLMDNCLMNRRDLLNRIRYIERKAYDDWKHEKYSREYVRAVEHSYCAVKVFGK